jgi:hypothetical protein
MIDQAECVFFKKFSMALNNEVGKRMVLATLKFPEIHWIGNLPKKPCLLVQHEVLSKHAGLGKTSRSFEV